MVLLTTSGDLVKSSNFGSTINKRNCMTERGQDGGSDLLIHQNAMHEGRAFHCSEIHVSCATRLILRKRSISTANCGTSLKTSLSNPVSVTKSCGDDNDSSSSLVDDLYCDPHVEVSSEISSDTEASLCGYENKNDNPSTMVHTSQISDVQSTSLDTVGDSLS